MKKLKCVLYSAAILLCLTHLVQLNAIPFFNKFVENNYKDLSDQISFIACNRGPNEGKIYCKG